MGAQPATDSLYEFNDCGSTVRISLEVSGSALDIDVQSTGDSLKVVDKRTSRTLLNVLQLFSTVDASATRSSMSCDQTCWLAKALQFSLSDGNLMITLTKLETNLPWPSLEAQTDVLTNQSEAVSETQTSRALEERENVKALLIAAQSGRVSDLQAAAQHFKGQHLGDIKDGTGKNALHFAAQLGQTDVCQYLLAEHQVNANTQDEAGVWAWLLTRPAHILSPAFLDYMLPVAFLPTACQGCPPPMPGCLLQGRQH